MRMSYVKLPFFCLAFFFLLKERKKKIPFERKICRNTEYDKEKLLILLFYSYIYFFVCLYFANSGKMSHKDLEILRNKR
jgi:hypothetical protein